MRFLMTCLCLWMMQAHAALALPSSITLVADAWCPYNCSPGSPNPGYAIELARAIYEPHGIKVHYEIMPWTRAINETRQTHFNGIIGAARKEAPDFIYPTEIMGFSFYRFYTLPESTWKYTDVDSLKGVSLGAVDGYSYGEKINEYLDLNRQNRAAVQLVSGELAGEQNIRKLLAHRIDVMIEDPNVVANSLKRMDKKEALRIAGVLRNPKISSDELYIAFSPNNEDSQALAGLFDEGIKRLRKTGELAIILDRYGISDWK
jgi:polar amino acid transport system substrate-binding protein